MNRAFLVVVVGLALSACGKKEESKGKEIGSATGSGSASASGTGTAAPAAKATGLLAAPAEESRALGFVKADALGMAAAAAPAPAAENAACKAACDHRAECGLGDASACTPECSALVAAGTLADADLEGYSKQACDAVKGVEPQFQLATACRGACVHRGECIDGAELKACIPDCATLVVALKADPEDALGDYMKFSCDQVKEQEPMLTCLHGCQHVLGCGVAGDLPSCLGYCTDQLQHGLTVEKIDEITKADCEQVKQTVQLPQPAAPPTGKGYLCTAQGVYEVCDGSSCRDEVSTSMGAGATEDDAKLEAVSQCSSHMLQTVVIQQLNNRAGVKQNCQITKC